MKIPSSVKVGGKTYTVEYPYVFQEREDVVGGTNNEVNRIRIANQTHGRPRPIENVEETFFHEVIHAVDSVYNANSLAEETVTRLSEGLYQVFKDAGLLAD